MCLAIQERADQICKIDLLPPALRDKLKAE
jgi:hypothetical protein